jgi:heme o synthase
MKNANSIALMRTNVVADYIMMMKPELTLLSVVTAVCSAYIALGSSSHYIFLLHTFIATILIGGSCGVLNHYIERDYDTMMKRTSQRPLPAGRIQPSDALLFGVILAVSGLLYIVLFTNWVSAALSLLTMVIYLTIYTPLKRKTPFATVIGGIPGGLPPLIGWAIVRGGLSMEAWSLFFILFFWQMPHFLSLSWMYRKDYERANYKMLTVLDPGGIIVSRQVLVYSIALIFASIMPVVVGLKDFVYLVGALVLSFGFLLLSINLFREKSHLAARKLFFASLAFLPLLFFMLAVA